MHHPAANEPEPQQARDVVAFGQEFGRVLSDGRIVGRAEPFAKVFPSSRAVKRAEGVTAWAILEDIALDANLDVEGRLVAETNVRRIAKNLGLAKNTVAKHLAKLREHGFVLHEEGRDRDAGRFETARYVLDPTAALERFTVTPLSERPSAGAGRPDPIDSDPRRKGCDTVQEPCRNDCDTAPCPGSCDMAQIGAGGRSSPTSHSARHREVGHHSETVAVDQQLSLAQTSDAQDDASIDADELLRRLTDLGVDEGTVLELVAEHPVEAVRDALDAVSGVDARKPAGWVVSAIRGGWDVADLATEQRRAASRRRRSQSMAASVDRRRETEAEALERIDAWFTAAVAALDPDQLDAAVSALTQPIPALGRRVLAEGRARLARWAAASHLVCPDEPLDHALVAALEQVRDFDWQQAPQDLPQPPHGQHHLPTADADRLVDQALERADARHRSELQEAER